MKQMLIAFFFSLSAFFVHQGQPDTAVHGVITDAGTGLPVAGATVTAKTTRHRVATDSTGHFAITVNDDPDILIFSAPGYQQLSMTVSGDQPALSVRMSRLTTQLNDVVVLGYGVKKDSEVEYSEQRIPRQLQGIASGLVLAKSNARNHKARIMPATNTEGYAPITENRFQRTAGNPLSTFSIDVDGASYSNVRRWLNEGQLPPAGSVRIEELINYFHYDYPQPVNNDPFSINTEIAACPWNPQHQLVMVGLQGKRISAENLPAANLVFLIDVSGSMMDENKLPLVKSSLKLLVGQLREKDKVAIVVYAGNAGLVLPSTPGSKKQAINEAIDALEAGGSTAGGEGIRLAYKIATENFMKGANNRIILCTDGDFNVGASSDADMVQLIETERNTGIYLTVLGYGMGNYQDSKMELLADKGNGNHAYIDNLSEAKKVLISEFGGTLFTIAKDVKLQVEFNPAKVQAYRLVGYENRLLNKEDFNNDKKDAGELGSGHTVTALYELIPVGVTNEFEEKVDKLKYQHPSKISDNENGEMMTIKFRYKQPDLDRSALITHVVSAQNAAAPTANFLFVSSVAEFGMLLTHSEFRQQANFDNALSLARQGIGQDSEGYRAEFIQLTEKAAGLMNNIKAVSIRK